MLGCAEPAQRQGVPLISPPPRHTADGPLVLADIGGYTSFLQAVALAHADDAFANGAIPDAYAMMSSLLDGILSRLVPPFILSKLEGDAVFAYATDLTDVPQGAALLACVAACYGEFRRRLAQAHELWTCTCDACLRVDSLDLKFVLHAGPFVVEDIAGRQELVGAQVVLAHRLLKTEAAGVVGHAAYVLLTAAAAARFAVPTEGAIPLVAEIEHYPPIETLVIPLRPPSAPSAPGTDGATRIAGS